MNNSLRAGIEIPDENKNSLIRLLAFETFMPQDCNGRAHGIMRLMIALILQSDSHLSDTDKS